MVMASEKSLTYAPLIPVTTFERVEGEVPLEAVRYFSEGIALVDQGKYEEAIAAFDEAVTYREEFPEA